MIQKYQVSHVIVRMFTSDELPSKDISRAQVQSARDNGCTVGAYVWAYKSCDPRKTIREAVELAQECGVDLKVLWIDCETYTEKDPKTGKYVVRDPGPDGVWLRAAVDECYTLGIQPGIYTGSWWWVGYMGNTTEFWELPLWVGAQYDGVETLESVILFGGWEKATIKQYLGDPDLNVLQENF